MKRTGDASEKASEEVRIRKKNRLYLEIEKEL